MAIPTPPNNSIVNGNPRNGSSPLTRGASPMSPPNAGIKDGNAKNGFSSLARGASPVAGSNESLEFKVSDAKMPQPQSAMQPGKGAIAVGPFTGPNGMTTLSPKMPDKAK